MTSTNPDSNYLMSVKIQEILRSPNFPEHLRPQLRRYLSDLYGDPAPTVPSSYHSETPYFFVELEDDQPCCCCWIRDMVMDGDVESNPGPNIIILLLAVNVIFVSVVVSPMDALVWVGSWVVDTLRVFVDLFTSMLRASVVAQFDLTDQELKLLDPPGTHTVAPNYYQFMRGIKELNIILRKISLRIVSYLSTPIIHFPTKEDMYAYFKETHFDYEKFRSFCDGSSNRTRCLMHLVDDIQDLETRLSLQKLFHEKIIDAEYHAIMRTVGFIINKEMCNKIDEAAENIWLGGSGILGTVNNFFMNSWHISVKAWNKLMHSINGNTTVGSKIRVNKGKGKKGHKKSNSKKSLFAVASSSMQAQAFADESTQEKGFKKLTHMSLRQWSEIVDISGKEASDIVGIVKNKLLETLQNLPERIRKMYSRNAVHNIASNAVRSAFRNDNGVWICKFCGRIGCKYQPIHVPEDQVDAVQENAPHPICSSCRGAHLFKSCPTNPNRVMPLVCLICKGAHTIFNCPTRKNTGCWKCGESHLLADCPEERPALKQPDSVVLTQADPNPVPIVLNDRDLLINLLDCRSRKALYRVAMAEPIDSQGVIIQRIAALIRTLRARSGINSSHHEDEADAVELWTRADDSEPTEVPLPHIEKISALNVDIHGTDSVDAEFNKGLENLYMTQRMNYQAKMPCFHCHALHPQLCLPILRHVQVEKWAECPRFKSLLRKHGALELDSLPSQSFRQFGAWVPLGDRARWWYNTLLRNTHLTKTLLPDRPVRATVTPTGRRKILNVERVDFELDRSLDPSFYRNPDVIEVEIRTSTWFKTYTRTAWISCALLVDFVGRSNSGITRITDLPGFLSHMDRLNRTSDNVRLPEDLNLKMPNLIPDTMLIAVYMLYAKADSLGLTVNRLDDCDTQSYTAMVGSLGKIFRYIVILILVSVCLYVVVALFVAVVDALLLNSQWQQAYNSTVQMEPSLDLRSTTELRPSEEASTGQVVEHLKQIQERFENSRERPGI